MEPFRKRDYRLLQRLLHPLTRVAKQSKYPSLIGNLCKDCRRLRIEDLRSVHGFIHSMPEEIITAARAGCPLCALVEDNFDLGPTSIPVTLHGIRRNLPSAGTGPFLHGGDIEAIRVVNGYDRDIDNPFAHRLAFWTYHSRSRPATISDKGDRIILLTKLDDPAAMSIQRRPPIQDFASQECSQLMKSWLDTCVYRHPACTAPVICRLPTRVIDVGTRDSAILFKPPPGFQSSYIALSYCWGITETKYVLTKEMAETSNLVFHSSSWPKTIVDAAQITRNLGFRFLWVDALCIIQKGDNGEDFQRESTTMHEVYGNATLTLAAAASKDVSEGIFRCPKPKSHPDCEIAYDLQNGISGTVHVVFEDNQEGDARIQEPLNTRGWTFQERVLSPRTIIFYQDQLSWDCTSILVNSNGPLNPLRDKNQDSPGRYSDYISDEAGAVLSSNSPKDNSRGSATETRVCMDYWKKMVEFYSLRNFTNSGDKLRAISGCAQLIKSKTNDVYMAGMWRAGLASQIFWYADDTSSTRQKEYRAPTWSWASVNGKIKFWRSEMLVTPASALKSHSGRPPRSMSTGPGDLDIHAVDIQYSDTAATGEFGNISRGLLSIRGVLKSWKQGDGDEIPMKSGLSESGIFFDQAIDEVYFFLHVHGLEYFLFYPSSSGLLKYYALILKRREGDTAFERVGMLGDAVVAFELYYERSKANTDTNETEIITIE